MHPAHAMPTYDRRAKSKRQRDCSQNMGDAGEQWLHSLMSRAHEFERNEQMDLLRQPLAGELFKFTNVVQGWQLRWFEFDAASASLRYYLSDWHRAQGRVRGCVQLGAAHVTAVEDEAGQEFHIQALNNEVYKLRAANAKQRQTWMNRIRLCIEDERIKSLLPPASPNTGPQQLHAVLAQANEHHQVIGSEWVVIAENERRDLRGAQGRARRRGGAAAVPAQVAGQLGLRLGAGVPVPGAVSAHARQQTAQAKTGSRYD